MNINPDILVDEAVAVSAAVSRLTAPNPGLMTGPGTNCYIIGEPGNYAVIDPGPAIAEHVERILNIVGEGLQQIIVTHTHKDHSPAAALLKQRTGALCIGAPSTEDAERQFQDDTFLADHKLEEGESLLIGAKTLRAIATPGHVSNHFCFLLEEEGMLFAGDHLMQGSTVVIVPPQGSLQSYLQSLDKLLNEDIRVIAPAHGLLIYEPAEEIKRIIAHRNWREQKILKVLRANSSVSLDTPDLLKQVYDDVSESLHWAAKYSLFAHLEKLLKEGRISSSDSEVIEKSSVSIDAIDAVNWSGL